MVKSLYYTFIPINNNLIIEQPFMFYIYIWWRLNKWFKKNEKELMFDRHEYPGEITENKWNIWAKSKGMKIGLLTDLPIEGQELIKKYKKISEVKELIRTYKKCIIAH